MKLPNAKFVVVEKEKITAYLLNAAHPDNGGKATFFLSMGFTLGAWTEFAAALRALAEISEVFESLESPHGMKYILDGPIDAPTGKTPIVRTVWIVDKGRDRPRLVTAYPKGTNDDQGTR